MQHFLHIGIRGPLANQGNRDNFLSEATRVSFITRQDARNIVRTLDSVVKHRHNNDAVSVDRLCKELQNEEDSPIIAYKPQGRAHEKYPGLSEDSFLLVIMTNFQWQCFKSTVIKLYVLIPPTRQIHMGSS